MRSTLCLSISAFAIATLTACGGGGGGSGIVAEGSITPPPITVPSTVTVADTPAETPAPAPGNPPPPLPEPNSDDVLGPASETPSWEGGDKSNWFPGEPNFTPPPLPGGNDPAVNGIESPGQQGASGGPPTQPVPEPEEVALFLMGAALLLFVLWRRGVFDRPEPLMDIA